MIRLVCVDVDGTLVGSTGEVHAEVWAAAERVRAAGVRLAICSGRPAFGVTGEYARRLDPSGWHIFQNGASVVHLPTHRSRSARVPDETVAMLVDRARAHGRLLELYGDDDYATESDSDRSRAHAALLGVPFRARPFESLGQPVVRALWLLRPDETEAVLAEPHPGLELAPSTSPVMPGTVFVNMTPVGATKGTAVRTVAEADGIALADVMFVGDGWNDAEPMGIVGHPVAMANADPAALAAARHVVGHVDDAGLVEALAMALPTPKGV